MDPEEPQSLRLARNSLDGRCGLAPSAALGAPIGRDGDDPMARGSSVLRRHTHTLVSSQL